MLAIGRALMLCPKLLILDEATEGLAPIIRKKIWQCLRSLKESGLSILLIDKNLDELAPLTDRTYIMEKGRVVWEGQTSRLTRTEDVRLRYLGV
jgi:branched-chain amino acid transport system ATP-binding protein